MRYQKYILYFVVEKSLIVVWNIFLSKPNWKQLKLRHLINRNTDREHISETTYSPSILRPLEITSHKDGLHLRCILLHSSSHHWRVSPVLLNFSRKSGDCKRSRREKPDFNVLDHSFWRAENWLQESHRSVQQPEPAGVTGIPAPHPHQHPLPGSRGVVHHPPQPPAHCVPHPQVGVQ